MIAFFLFRGNIFQYSIFNIDYCLDPDKIFVPSNYLISPFNSTDKFVRGEYFLTSAQQKVKDEIYSELEAAPFMFFCISANAGTGKTLLTYDIAKEQISQGKKVLLIHCGKLNDGHRRLIDQEGWDIRPIRSIPQNSDFVVLDDFNYIFIDESQRIRTLQLEALMIKIIEKKIPTIFSFDTKQYLREGETRDLGEYLTSVIGILLPTLVYMYSARTLDIKLEESQPVKESKTFRFGDIPMVLFIIVLVGLISGKFTYSIIGIGSESMTPTIDKGDAVIYKSITDESDLNVGDIIVFKNGSKIIIHRLIEIKEDENKNYYITKGDANNSKDNINLTIEDIKGKVLFKIKYLAYPNLWLKEIVNKE